MLTLCLQVIEIFLLPILFTVSFLLHFVKFLERFLVLHSELPWFYLGLESNALLLLSIGEGDYLFIVLLNHYLTGTDCHVT